MLEHKMPLRNREQREQKYRMVKAKRVNLPIKTKYLQICFHQYGDQKDKDQYGIPLRNSLFVPWKKAGSHYIEQFYPFSVAMRNSRRTSIAAVFV